MRRADRLFELVRLLRRKRAVTGAFLARELGVSLRTVYRDVADLIGSGVPIEGEAGVGYRLGDGFELPPLMFRDAELEALVLGARLVVASGDPELASAAKHAFDRIARVLPKRLRARVDSVRLYAPRLAVPATGRDHLPGLRRAIAARMRLRIGYVREDGVASERVVRPLGLAFFGRQWVVVTFCELRQDFRSLRLDRITTLEPTGTIFDPEPERTLDAFFALEGITGAGNLDPATGGDD